MSEEKLRSCIYVGVGGDVVVALQNGQIVTFKDVEAETALPILYTHICEGTTAKILELILPPPPQKVRKSWIKRLKERLTKKG